MTYTSNLPDDDPRQRLYELQKKVLADEELTEAEIVEAVELLRQTRGRAVDRKTESAERRAAKSEPIDLNSLFDK